MEIKQFSLVNDNHQLTFTNIGASLMKWQTRNSSGEIIDVVLGFNKPDQYLDNHPSFGAVVGRYANRIAESRFNLHGASYQLEANIGKHHIHGGSKNYGTKMWQCIEQGENFLTFGLFSPHLDGNYPGNLEVEVKYTLFENGQLQIKYQAISDKDTYCNLTNHSYFNLNGESSGEVYTDHLFQINASHFLPTDSEGIPTGVYQSVENTIMDLRTSQKLNANEFNKDPLFVHTRAYDHNYVLGRDRSMRHAATVRSGASGLRLDCYTDKPGLQFYLACFLEHFQSKTGTEYKPFHAFCLEAQYFPDSPNQSNFPSSLLKANTSYKQETIYHIHLE